MVTHYKATAIETSLLPLIEGLWAASVGVNEYNRLFSAVCQREASIIVLPKNKSASVRRQRFVHSQAREE
jgi:hypothetical protein